MKTLFVLAVASLVATSANAAEMKWSGSAGWRSERAVLNDGLSSHALPNGAGAETSKQTTRAHSIRANIGATGGWENVEWGVGVRTKNAANDDHVLLQNNTDSTIGFDQAWFRYLRDFGSMDFSLTVGRQKNAIAYDNVTQTLFDNDVRWDGFGWQFKFGMFGFNAAQYITGARVQTTATQSGDAGSSSFSRTDATENQRRFHYLFAFQPYMNWKFSDEIETMFAVGYLLWQDSANVNHMGAPRATAYNTGTPAPIAGLDYRIHNPRQWQILSTWTLPWNLSLNAEFVLNKRQTLDANTAVNGDPATVTATGAPSTLVARPEVSRSAWMAMLNYGSLRKARDFTIGYGYGKKGIGSVIGNYSYEKFAPGWKGHAINLGYALADNFHIGFKNIFAKEVDKINPNTGVAYTGVNAMQHQKWTYSELTAGVMF